MLFTEACFELLTLINARWIYQLVMKRSKLVIHLTVKMAHVCNFIAFSSYSCSHGEGRGLRGTGRVARPRHGSVSSSRVQTTGFGGQTHGHAGGDLRKVLRKGDKRKREKHFHMFWYS